MDGGAWWAAVHRVTNSRTRLCDFNFTFYFHALEKEMATHSGVLAWRIPGTGEPGGLPSMGSQSRTRLKRLSSSSSNWKVEPSLSEDNLMLYKENIVNSNKNPSELVNEFSEVAGYKINNRNL